MIKTEKLLTKNVSQPNVNFKVISNTYLTILYCFKQFLLDAGSEITPILQMD